MIFEKASAKDTEEILALYRSMIGGMADWTMDYPSLETIAFDLSHNDLYLMREATDNTPDNASYNNSGKIIAVASIDHDPLVIPLPCWTPSLQPSAELSRICIRKDYQGRGLSKVIINNVLEILKNRELKSAHMLVLPAHTIAIKSYKSLGFVEVGECDLYDRHFLCLEKVL